MLDHGTFSSSLIKWTLTGKFWKLFGEGPQWKVSMERFFGDVIGGLRCNLERQLSLQGALLPSCWRDGTEEFPEWKHLKTARQRMQMFVSWFWNNFCLERFSFLKVVKLVDWNNDLMVIHLGWGYRMFRNRAFFVVLGYVRQVVCVALVLVVWRTLR